MRITESIHVNRRPEDVWAVVADLDTHSAWRPALVAFEQVEDGPLRVGSRIREVLRFGRREIEIEDVVTALEPPSRLSLHGEWKAAEFDVDFRLEPEGEGTRVTMDWPLSPKSASMRVVTPFLRGMMRRATREELGHLKSFVEARPTAH